MKNIKEKLIVTGIKMRSNLIVTKEKTRAAYLEKQNFHYSFYCYLNSEQLNNVHSITVTYYITQYCLSIICERI
jgi:hypothetical protein